MTKILILEDDDFIRQQLAGIWIFSCGSGKRRTV